jgi:hypothetical protein
MTRHLLISFWPPKVADKTSKKLGFNFWNKNYFQPTFHMQTTKKYFRNLDKLIYDIQIAKALVKIHKKNPKPQNFQMHDLFFFWGKMMTQKTTIIDLFSLNGTL